MSPHPHQEKVVCIIQFDMAKERIKLLGLHRRGQRVCYTPVSVVKAAIHVSTGILIVMYAVLKLCTCMYILVG